MVSGVFEPELAMCVLAYSSRCACTLNYLPCLQEGVHNGRLGGRALRGYVNNLKRSGI